MEKRLCSEKTKQNIYDILLRGYEGNIEKAKRDYEKLNLACKTASVANDILLALRQRVKKRESKKLARIAKEKGLNLKIHSNIRLDNICKPIKKMQRIQLEKALRLAKMADEELDFTFEMLDDFDVGDAQALIDKWASWKYTTEQKLKRKGYFTSRLISPADVKAKLDKTIASIDDNTTKLKNGLTPYETAQYIINKHSNMNAGLDDAQQIKLLECYTEQACSANLDKVIISRLRFLYGSGVAFQDAKKKYDVYNLTNLEALYYAYVLCEEHDIRKFEREVKRAIKRREWEDCIIKKYGSLDEYHESLGWIKLDDGTYIKPTAERDTSIPDMMKQFNTKNYIKGKRHGTRGKLVF